MGYDTKEQELEVAGRIWRMTTLKDRQQFHDPDGKFEMAGIAPAIWPLFGVVWSSGLLLAEIMAGERVAGRRILEIGCGLGLSSLVLQARSADVLASDIHPLAGEFLQKNAAANNIEAPPFIAIDWRTPPVLEPFDLIIGSDLLYERDQPAALAAFMHSSCRDNGNVIITDPGRRQTGTFSREMANFGFICQEPMNGKAKVLRYSRSTRLQ